MVYGQGAQGSGPTGRAWEREEGVAPVPPRDRRGCQRALGDAISLAPLAGPARTINQGPGPAVTTKNHDLGLAMIGAGSFPVALGLWKTASHAKSPEPGKGVA